MKPVIVPVLSTLFLLGLPAWHASAAEPAREQAGRLDALGARQPTREPTLPTREQMESAQTDGLGYRRGKKRDDDNWFEPMRMNQEADAAKAGAVRASSAPGSQSVTTGAGTHTSSGVVSAGGDAASSSPSSGRSGSSGKGIVNAAGGRGASGHGRADDAPGHARRSGIVTGAGALPAGARGHGHGIVTGAGAATATSAASSAAAASAGVAGTPVGAGIVTGAGAAVVPSAVAHGARAHIGIVTGAGGPPGHANAHGHGRRGGH